ncbi:MAG: hypothetical protein K2X77_31130 [Candidatus Obscuribacterales bacterium]|jgi:hypothetical protein|nr:hypothetical protein [Candidatus Obscuribacterales bacterium]
MSDSKQLERAHAFFDQLKQEIKSLAREVNEHNDGTLHDGFCTKDIEDGWVAYKGLSCGFALQPEPLAIDMTYGPDGPFVGYRIQLIPYELGSQIAWVDSNHDLRFYSPMHLARYCLETLAARAHDTLPSSFFGSKETINWSASDHYR